MTDPQPMSAARRIALATVAAASIALPAEGLRRIAYKDPASITTICVGHTGPDVQMGQIKSRDECMAILSDDMRQAVEKVDRCQPGLPLSVLIAFSDATFNAGPTVACDRKKSTAARLLSMHQYKLACQELPRWNKARIGGTLVELPGLTTRRNREMEVCLQEA